MMAEKIQILLIKRNMKKSDLAAAIDCSPSNLYNKLKRDNFSERELMQIAEVLNCTYEATFTFNDTGEKL